jgi:tellurite resistance-related uncharacterized protein
VVIQQIKFPITEPEVYHSFLLFSDDVTIKFFFYVLLLNQL